MQRISAELKVGIFALVVIAILSFMTFKTGGFTWTKKEGYVLFVQFRNIAGLDEKTKVRVAGVEAGIIDSISLVAGRARIAFRVNPDIEIYRNATASIKTTGLLGDKYLNIETGSSDRPRLSDGDTIEHSMEFVDMDDFARNILRISDSFTSLAETLNAIIGTEEARDSITQIIASLRNVLAGLDRTIEVNDEKLQSVLDNMDRLTVSLNSLVEENRGSLTSSLKNMEEFSAAMKKDAPELMANLKEATRELEALIEENRPGIKSTVESFDSIARDINKGEGSLGKMLKDDRLYDSLTEAASKVNKTLSSVDRFRTYLSFRTEYLTKPDDAKGQFSITFQPERDKYYILGVVSDPIGHVTTTETITTPPGTFVREEEIERKVEFTAHIARRFGDAAVRFGLTENTFGAGGDYFFYDDRGRVTADIWDFSHDEEEADNPHVKIGLDYFLFRNIFVSAGIDNLLNDKWRGGYVGVGVQFEDEDIKYLLGTMPRFSTR